ncbi:hypothetical protein NECAME_09812 [Necator americanus]|uniref:Uncharacterized protein n=1 Tax=Necator americanus TaxID=51031 RepID=W2TBM7_NECAM|nr:hypothetical protein NECAME_09812 [Necator americanus]ETN79445.1 hypothetical protein NECAME_09812 [Necator americanus]
MYYMPPQRPVWKRSQYFPVALHLAKRYVAALWVDWEEIEFHVEICLGILRNHVKTPKIYMKSNFLYM